MKNKQHTLTNSYGVLYYLPFTRAVVEALETDLYMYRAYMGEHTIEIDKGDCAYFLSEDKKTAHLKRGPATFFSAHSATLIRGYMPQDKTCSISYNTTLPYINGCSTKQIFPPERLGDPTLQLLYMPPYTSEQAHHIHSTVRVVYVLAGSGICVVGMKNHIMREKLCSGMTLILNAMCPHHFETEYEPLIVLPLHIFSSVGKSEYNHPMFNGTHTIEA